MLAATVTVNVNGSAQIPAAGVNVYVPEFTLLTTVGLHVPLTPLSDVLGNAGTLPPEQIVIDAKLNVGITLGFTVTVNVVGVAQTPADGVKV
jgi:hypothetical protein